MKVLRKRAAKRGPPSHVEHAQTWEVPKEVLLVVLMLSTSFAIHGTGVQESGKNAEWLKPSCRKELEPNGYGCSFGTWCAGRVVCNLPAVALGILHL